MWYVSRHKIGNKLTTFAAIAFAFIIAGIIYSENRTIGYSLLGIGVAFAFMDIVQKL